MHFVIDEQAAEELAGEWREHGLANLALELIDCPDRRLTRAAVETVAHELGSGDAEVCVLLPERMFNGVWHRILHDQTAESLAREISRLPHANVTTVPFHFDDRTVLVAPANGDRPSPAGGKVRSPKVTRAAVRVDGTTSIGTVRLAPTRARARGESKLCACTRWRGARASSARSPTTVARIAAVFLGRHEIGGSRSAAPSWWRAWSSSTTAASRSSTRSTSC